MEWDGEEDTSPVRRGKATVFTGQCLLIPTATLAGSAFLARSGLIIVKAQLTSPGGV